MSNNPRLYWLHALSSLHVGAGRGVGYIDLPIMREKVTGWPLVPGSAVKGVLADHYGATDEKRDGDAKLRAAFGRGGDEHSNSGSLVFSDARLICFPVRSLFGTFAWCTSPSVLARFARDLDSARRRGDLTSPTSLKLDEVHLTSNDSVLKGNDGKVYLEDLDLSTTTCDTAAQWAKGISDYMFSTGDDSAAKAFQSRFAVVSDDVFNFLTQTGTEVNARVRIDDQKKTVAGGALWYEEALPAESILAGLVWCDRVFGANGVKPQDLFAAYCKDIDNLQIGGNATIGKGRVRCAFTEQEPANV